MEDIRRGILLRFNDMPYAIDVDSNNKVIKETPHFYVINIRDKTTLEFYAHLDQTPFDRFSIPFKVEMTSKSSSGTLYRFNCHINDKDHNSNISYKDDPNKLHDFHIDFSQPNVELVKEYKKDNRKRIIYEYYPALIYHICLFRRPGPIIGTLFLPMFILTLM